MFENYLGGSVSVLKQNFLLWLFDLDRKKNFTSNYFGLFCCLSCIFLAFTLRLETFDYLYLSDTYIGGLIAIISTLSVFVMQGLYKNIARYISIETVFGIAIGSTLSCLVLFFGILLLKLRYHFQFL